MHERPNFAGSSPVRSRSLDQAVMGDVEGTPRYDQRADSAICIDDDEDEYPQPRAKMSPLTILGVGCIDPFANYPVKMDLTEYWLIDHGMLQLSFTQNLKAKSVREMLERKSLIYDSQ